MASAGTIDIQETFGAMLIGTFVMMVVYGITTLQSYFYFVSFPKDGLPTKALVAFIWFLDTLHAVLVGHCMHFYLVAGFADHSLLANGNWCVTLSLATNLLEAFIVQLFFIRRIFICRAFVSELDRTKFDLNLQYAPNGSGGGKLHLTANVLQVFGLKTVVDLFATKEFVRLKTLSFSSVIPFGLSVVLSDILIAVALCILLYNNRSEFSDTNSIINKLIVYTINRCILTTAVAIAETVVFSALPDTFYSFAMDFIIGKLYANSLLAVLNSRAVLRAPSRDDMSSTELSTRFHVASAVANHQTSLFQVRTRGSDREEDVFSESESAKVEAGPMKEARIYTTVKHECRPLAFPVEAQCQHVEESCPPPDTVLNIDYLHLYYCSKPSLRPVIFAGLIVWLIFLFSTLGISASDFFTPNLATIAHLLGLDENVAGVTFLAFGNGSPDLFSTFSAMRADSGSLAIGELLGAATFIVSCVVGSMCIIKPFQVHRTSFLRDVGFFTIAIGLMLLTHWDGHISQWEAGTLVALYLTYVLVVVIGSWYERRRERLQLSLAQARDEFAEPMPQYTDEAPPTMTLTPPAPRVRAISAPNPPRIQTAVTSRPYSRSPSPTPVHTTQIPSFSLVGALEFRDVVSSLRKQSAATSLGIFESPVTPYAGGHYHTHSRFSSTRSPLASLRSSMDEETLNGLRLGTRSHPGTLSPHSMVRTEPVDLLSGDAEDYFSNHVNGQPPVPAIFRTPASPSATASEADSEEQLYTPQTKRQRVLAALWQTYHTLFPTLHNFKSQTIITKIARLLAAPAVLCLTLTLPVVVTPYPNAQSAPEKLYDGDARLVDFEEEGMERVLIAEEEIEIMHELPFILFGGNNSSIWVQLGTLIGGLIAGALVVMYVEKGNSPAALLARCLMGFFVAIVWIMAIADQVVNVLQTFGFMFGLSDAIIGLTIFAVGNSLADLVANMSVAVFAPIMGFSACFGGPMLNLLLGVGISGSYIISQTSEPYALKLSTTLFVSAFGLLFLLAATLIFVPLNDYFLTRRWGYLLIASYTIIMIINIVVELKH
ncbi:hypothetical protein CVT26_000239 [Gymnopilus dilepis]|uniref:Sodium/calcium exchanger membrane region domain-containing protein n=1 Tax=Gymnopilus dilepis TaxID=231916 RepID=A0A409VG92_9AGAR|nr:hypothetical protein CVT26_000239 [Gymnopilus dilepis]